MGGFLGIFLAPGTGQPKHVMNLWAWPLVEVQSRFSFVFQSYARACGSLQRAGPKSSSQFI